MPETGFCLKPSLCNRLLLDPARDTVAQPTPSHGLEGARTGVIAMVPYFRAIGSPDRGPFRHEMH
ncbi:hypothetical protein DA075_00405 [Methylobacterium currus]|uniref:Uncharacterized protein n=1 Tax=Methylobacterium currus TaxID=2051553 RepID=A0A2R4WDE7_9HYPH|nr:hypothetical protein DA075_00405 [Methylobacterium currus]